MAHGGRGPAGRHRPAGVEAIQKRFLPGKAPLKLNLPSGPKYLNAEVLADTARITYNQQEYDCHIIEYRGENETFRTYVRISDGWVLRQESKTFDQRIVMQRQ